MVEYRRVRKKGVETVEKLENLYTIEETANYLRVSPSTIYRWLENGKLKSSKIEQKHLIAESEIKKLLKGE
jgi:excisionase family DNA binding protein